MNVTKLWQKATSRIVCSKTNCAHCHEIYNVEQCPADGITDTEPVLDFVERVSNLLRRQDNTDEVFFSDEEFVQLLKAAAEETVSEYCSH